MMLVALVTLALLPLVSSTPDSDWVSDILASKRARTVDQILTQVVKTESGQVAYSMTKAKPGDVDVTINHAICFDPDAEQKAQLIKDAASAAEGFYNLGQYEEAYQTLKAFDTIHPNLAGSTRSSQIQYAFLAKHYKEAYESIITIFRGHPSPPKGKPISPHYKLMLSLACAVYGEVYPGQAEFCLDIAIDGLANQALLNVEMDPKLANRKDSKAVAIMSCMGLGLKYGLTPYLEFAMRLDPTNVIVANELICYYGLRNNKAAIIRIATNILKALPAGDANREKFVKDLAEYK